MVNRRMLEEIFKVFYNLKTYERQKEFICRHDVEKETRVNLKSDKQLVSKTRYVWRHYNFTVGGSLLPVCKSFLIQTLGTGHAYIQHAVENREDGIFTGEERRGRRTPSNKIPEEKKSQLKKRVESFPAVESHHCRKGTDKNTSTPDCPSTKCIK